MPDTDFVKGDARSSRFSLRVIKHFECSFNIRSKEQPAAVSLGNVSILLAHELVEDGAPARADQDERARGDSPGLQMRPHHRDLSQGTDPARQSQGGVAIFDQGEKALLDGSKASLLLHPHIGSYRTPGFDLLAGDANHMPPTFRYPARDRFHGPNIPASQHGVPGRTDQPAQLHGCLISRFTGLGLCSTEYGNTHDLFPLPTSPVIALQFYEDSLLQVDPGQAGKLQQVQRHVGQLVPKLFWVGDFICPLEMLQHFARLQGEGNY